MRTCEKNCCDRNVIKLGNVFAHEQKNTATYKQITRDKAQETTR